MDPAICTDDLTSLTFCEAVYQGLVGIGTTTTSSGEKVLDMTTRVPLLATSWNESADGTVWTFHLAHNVAFSNGDPFNSAAVLYTVNRCFTMGFTCAFFLGLAGMDANSTKVIDNYTVQFTVKPGPFMLQALFFMPIVDPAFVQANGGVVAGQPNTYMTTHAMGTGPFTLQSYDPATGAVFMRNPTYWGTPAAAAEINVKVVASDTTREELLQTNAVQLINLVPAADVTTMQQASGVTVYQNVGNGELYLDMSWKAAPFNNTLVRQAIAYAIPYGQILQQAEYGYASQLTSVVPNNAYGYNGSFWQYSQNIAKAKALLTQAGYPSGFTATLQIQSGFSDQASAATIIQSGLAQIGITVTIQSISTSTFSTLWTSGQLTFFITKLNPAINDIRYVAEGFMTPTGFANFDHLDNATITALANNIYYGPANNQTGFSLFQKEINEEPNWVLLYQYPDLTGGNTHLHGFEYCNFELFFFQTLYTT
ncbi:MAG: ABC transporter substrate-binding protein [Thaumarchaeota archaeon]|nr:ABC transporter substrate-binding protein [Nitrososphaerota archaeon]